jgi:hypothetical protein
MLEAEQRLLGGSEICPSVCLRRTWRGSQFDPRRNQEMTITLSALSVIPAPCNQQFYLFKHIN